MSNDNKKIHAEVLERKDMNKEIASFLDEKSFCRFKALNTTINQSMVDFLETKNGSLLNKAVHEQQLLAARNDIEGGDIYLTLTNDDLPSAQELKVQNPDFSTCYRVKLFSTGIFGLFCSNALIVIGGLFLAKAREEESSSYKAIDNGIGAVCIAVGAFGDAYFINGARKSWRACTKTSELLAHPTLQASDNKNKLTPLLQDYSPEEDEEKKSLRVKF